MTEFCVDLTVAVIVSRHHLPDKWLAFLHMRKIASMQLPFRIVLLHTSKWVRWPWIIFMMFAREQRTCFKIKSSEQWNETYLLIELNSDRFSFRICTSSHGMILHLLISYLFSYWLTIDAIFVGHLALARVLDCVVILATGKAEVKKSIGLTTHIYEPKCQISSLLLWFCILSIISFFFGDQRGGGVPHLIKILF